MTSMKFRVLFGVTFLVSQVLLSSCVSNLESDVVLTPTISQDTPYKEALQKATRDRTVFKNFETKAIVHATYLSPEFRAAFAERLNRIFKRSDVHFDDTKDKAAFMVSLEVPGIWYERNDLTDPYQWTITMDSDQGPIRPVMIKRILDKERWRPYFTHVTEWSGEFLVVFDAPSVNPNSDQMVVKTPVKLTIANADAQLNLTW